MRYTIILFTALIFLCCSCGGDQPTPKPEPTPDTNEQNKPESADTLTLAPDTISLAVDTLKPPTDTVKREERPKRNPATMDFETTSHDYGTVEEGTVVEYKFKFKNTGERALEISDVQGSCSCTTGGFSFLPILPKEEGEISARVDTKGRKGVQNTYLTVMTNGEPKEYKLKLKGEVSPAE